MKKFYLSTLVVVSFIFYSLIERMIPRKSSQLISNNQTTSPNNIPLKDGQYTGVVADAFYGNVQVRAVINNNKISDVQFLDYPQDRPQSVAINVWAMPQLTAEAIQAQSANVDIVTGATATSQAFIQSLQSALTQAQN